MRTRASTLGLALLVAASWGVVLLAPNALFWDDWITVGGDVVNLYEDLGLPWMGHVAHALAEGGPVVFKMAGVACAVVVAVAARAIGERGLGLTSGQTWLLAALVALLPFNPGRVAVAVLSTYSISLAAFFLAWWLAVKEGRHRTARVASAAALFFLSFTTASLLPFIAVPVAHLFMLEADHAKPFRKELARFAVSRWHLLATPILFWLFRSVFLQPRGVYAGYNEFARWSSPPSLANVATAVMLIVAAGGAILLGVRAFVAHHRRAVDVGTAGVAGITTLAVAACICFLPGATSVDALVVTAILAGSGLVLLVAAVGEARRPRFSPMIGRAAFLASAGLAAFALGALPYVLVGKIPQFVDWETRHQLLLPVGTALLAVAAAVAAEGSSPRRGVAVRIAGLVTVAVSAAAVVAAGLSFVVDWHKQTQVIEALRHLEGVRDASTVIVQDGTSDLSFGGRDYRFYEPIGWLHTAYGDRTRFAIAEAETDDFGRGAFDGVASEGVRYGFPDWNPDGAQIGLLIEHDPLASWWDLLWDKPAIRVTTYDGAVDTSRIPRN